MRTLDRRRLTASTLGFVCLVGMAACDGHTGPAVDGQTADDLWHEAEERHAALVQSDEFKEATARKGTCMERAGYSPINGAVVLSDGTRYEPGGQIGELMAVTYALAEYFAARDGCEQESGLDALERSVLPEPLAAGEEKSIRQHNESFVATVSCLQDRGWRFREVLTILEGMLFTEPILGPGEQDAYDLDQAECSGQPGDQ